MEAGKDANDRSLGMDCKITRRDFVNSVSATVAGAMLLPNEQAGAAWRSGDKMLGGIAFMINGHMCCGVLKTDLMGAAHAGSGNQRAPATAYPAYGLYRQTDEVGDVR